MSELPRNKYANENSLCVPLNLMLALATNVLTCETQTIISIYRSPVVCKRTFFERQRARIKRGGSRAVSTHRELQAYKNWKTKTAARSGRRERTPIDHLNDGDGSKEPPGRPENLIAATGPRALG
jgi:hypothetical protein